MANEFLTAKGITREALRIAENAYGFSSTIYQGYEQKHFGNADPKEGSKLYIRLSNKYKVLNTLTYQDGYVDEHWVEMLLDSPRLIPLTFTDVEKALEMNSFSELFLKDAVKAMATSRDMAGTGLYKQVWNQVGDPQAGADIDYFFDANAVLVDSGLSQDGEWYAIISPNATAALQKSLRTQFNPTKDISMQYRTGILGEAAGFIFMTEQNVRTHYTGNFGTSCQLNAPLQKNVATVTLDNFVDLVGDPSVKEGDIFWITDVFSLNDQNKQNTGRYQQFVATADVTIAAGNPLVVPVAPIPNADAADPWQNISGYGIATAPVMFHGAQNSSYQVNLAYHKRAFCSASANLPIPQGVHSAYAESYKGTTMRFIQQYEGRPAQMITRLDMLFGHLSPYPEYAVRVASQPNAVMPTPPISSLSASAGEVDFIKNKKDKK
jgi:hypothetical protein